MSNLRPIFVKPLIVGFSIFMFSSVVLAQHYQQTNLVSNISGMASVTDPNLQNPWGLVSSPGSPWWVSDEINGLSTLYNGTGQIQGLVVTIPSASGKGTGHPTGIMFNGSTTNFLLGPGMPGLFMFVTLDGTIQAWNPGVSPTSAVVKVNNASKGAVYTGATIGEVGEKEMIFVANFHSGRIEAYDASFNRVALSEERFDDDQIPRDFAPFNIQGIGPNLYVTYARQNADKNFPIGGDGLGFVDVYSQKGRLLQRLEHGEWFNAPWGIVLTPENFGEFSHTVLIGDFLGSGTIAAFNPVTGRFLGNMLNPNGTTLEIGAGLWALRFGNGTGSGPANSLFFTAGPQGVNGLLGTLTPIASELGADDEQ